MVSVVVFWVLLLGRWIVNIPSFPSGPRWRRVTKTSSSSGFCLPSPEMDIATLRTG